MASSAVCVMCVSAWVCVMASSAVCASCDDAGVVSFSTLFFRYFVILLSCYFVFRYFVFSLSTH